MTTALALLIVAWCLWLEYRLHVITSLIFLPDEEEEAAEYAMMHDGRNSAVPQSAALHALHESAPVPGHASDEREARELAIQRGVDTLLSVARDQGVSMTEAQAREHAAFMLAEAGL